MLVILVFQQVKQLTTIWLFDHNDTPYVIYLDYEANQKATVMKYTGTAWETVGMAGFSTDFVERPVLAFDSNDTPYAAFPDGAALAATVMKYEEGHSPTPNGNTVMHRIEGYPLYAINIFWIRRSLLL